MATKQRKPSRSKNSSSSVPTERSKIAKEVLALGEALVEQFKLKADDDILGQWIAHRLAEKFTEHKNAKGAAKDVLGAELIDIILKFWEHRAIFPRGDAPFENYDAIIRALESFDPDRERYFSYRAANEAIDGATPASRQLIDLAKSLDSGTRALINFCFTYAAHASGKPPKAWLDAARVLEADADVRVVIRFVDASEALDASEKRKPTATELEIGELKDVQTNLAALIESANAIGEAVEARLKGLSSKVADNERVSVAKKKSARTVTKDGKAKSKKRLPAR